MTLDIINGEVNSVKEDTGKEIEVCWNEDHLYMISGALKDYQTVGDFLYVSHLSKDKEILKEHLHMIPLKDLLYLKFTTTPNPNS